MSARNVVLWVLLIPLAGCATTGQQCTPPAPSASNAAEVVVYRPHARQLFSSPISIDDCIVGELEEGSFIRYKVPAGRHKIRAEKRALADGGDGEMSSEFGAGTTTYLRFWLAKEKYRGFLIAPLYSWLGKFAVVDEATAKQELPGL
jgi:hypothetical protein